MNSFLLILSLIILPHPQKPDAYHDFISFVARNIKPDNNLNEDCTWKYALVEVNCNIDNRISSYFFLNEVSPEIKKHLSFLKGYQFSKKIGKRPIVFMITFENHNTDCILDNKALSAEVAKSTYAIITKQIKSHPNTIFLNEMAIVSYNYDPVR